MERVFWAQDQGDTIVELIESACKEYKTKMHKVHEEVKKLLPVYDVVTAFRSSVLEVGLLDIIMRNRYPIG